MEEKIYCSHCGAIIDTDDYGEINVQIVCSYCIENYTTTCDRCGAIIWNSDAYGDDYTSLCCHCYENYYTLCEECDALMHNMFHQALEQAKINGLIMQNPADNAIIPKSPKKEMRVLSVEEHMRLLSVIHMHRLGFAIKFDLATGLRIGELCALKWTDLNPMSASLITGILLLKKSI